MNITKKISFDFDTTQKLINILSQIDSFKGRWMTVEVKENVYLKELRRIATIQSIGSSTRIEGATLTDVEIKELLDKIKITKLSSRDAQEVVGYYDVLEIIYDSYPDMPLSETTIKSLHNVLLKYSEKDDRHKGNYKTLSNKVVANYPDGVQRVIFNTTEPHLVSKEIEDIICWTNQVLESKQIHSLIAIGTFIYEFLSIHPFQDGNGRLSRLLTTLLLLRSDYQFIKYVSFENLIEEKKSDYYKVLIAGQQHRNTDKEIIGSWLLFFFECLLTLTERLDKKYLTFKSKGGYVNDRQKQILQYVKDNQPIKVGDVARHFTEMPINTIKKDLLYMRNEKMLQTVGVGKGTVYIRIDE